MNAVARANDLEGDLTDDIAAPTSDFDLSSLPLEEYTEYLEKIYRMCILCA